MGGESGPGARPCWTPSVRVIVKQCRAAGVPVFVKQLGSNVCDRNNAFVFDDSVDFANYWIDVDYARIEHDLDGTRDGYQGVPVRVLLNDRKGADPSEWPADLRVREFPRERGR